MCQVAAASGGHPGVSRTFNYFRTPHPWMIGRVVVQ
jgi:hypothetical protein